MFNYRRKEAITHPTQPHVTGSGIHLFILLGRVIVLLLENRLRAAAAAAVIKYSVSGVRSRWRLLLLILVVCGGVLTHPRRQRPGWARRCRKLLCPCGPCTSCPPGSCTPPRTPTGHRRSPVLVWKPPPTPHPHIKTGGTCCDYLLVDGEGDGNGHKGEPAKDKAPPLESGPALGRQGQRARSPQGVWSHPWTKLVVPSTGSMIHVGLSVKMQACPFATDSSPMKLSQRGRRVEAQGSGSGVRGHQGCLTSVSLLQTSSSGSR